MSRIKNIFIYLNIPWNFIKQRPQFIAENMNKYFNVQIYYNKPYRSNYIMSSDNDKNNDIKLIERIKIPRKNKILRYLDNILQIFFIKKYLNVSDYIWIMHPEQYDILKNNLTNKKVIYDCMDDYSKFPNLSEYERMRVSNLEIELIKLSSNIFYSSESLRQIHNKRYGYIENSYVINNALNYKKEIHKDQKIIEYIHKIKGKKIVYIGAISEWFDFQVVENILNSNSKISIILFGPADVEIPKIERLYHYGKIEHHGVYTAMNCSDILIMPFKINELVIAVDPIKIYEYIYSEKPIIVPNYPEMDKFKGFVSVYNNINEAVELANSLEQVNDVDEVKQFIESNTWEARAKQIAQIIKNE